MYATNVHLQTLEPENLMNLDQLPTHGFKLAVFPVKWIGTTAAPVRAVAILED